jgi:membrane protein
MVQKALPLFLAFAPFVAKSVAFGAAYLIMPNHRVTFRSAAVGGLVAGAFWHVAEWFYITFQIKAGQSNAIYGALAQLPLFLIWVYIGWCVVLFGAELACILDLPGKGRRLKGGEDLWMPRPGAFLPVLREIGSRFERGEELPTAEGAVDSLGLHPEEGVKVVNVLVSAGFLALSGDTPQKLLPARSPRSVTMAEILTAVSRLEEEPAFAEEFVSTSSAPFSSLTWAEWALEKR